MNIIDLDNLIRQRPVSRRQLQALAHELGSRGGWKQLQEAFLGLRRDALHQDNLVGFIDYMLSQASFRLGDLRGAATLARSTIRLQPSFAYAYLVLGQCHSALGELDQALAALNRCCSLAPSLAWAWYELSIVHQQLHGWHSARIALIQARYCLSLPPMNRNSANIGRIVADALNRLEEAELKQTALELWGEHVKSVAVPDALTAVEQAELYLQFCSNQLNRLRRDLEV